MQTSEDERTEDAEYTAENIPEHAKHPGTLTYRFATANAVVSRCVYKKRATSSELYAYIYMTHGKP